MGVVERVKNHWRSLRRVHRRRGTVNTVEKALRWLGKQPQYHFRRYRRDVVVPADLRVFCSSRGNYWRYCDGCGVCVECDSVTPPVPPEFRSAAKTYSVGPSFVYELPNASLVTSDGTDGARLHKDGTLLLRNRDELLSSDPLDTPPSSSRRSSSDIERRRHRECVFPLVYGGSNFFVWMYEFLPQLRAREHYRETTGQTPEVVVSGDPPEWMVRSLRAVGVAEENIVELRSDQVSTDTLVFTTRRAIYTSGDYNLYCPDTLRWLRRTVIDGEIAENATRRIYISRQDADFRHVVNEGELLSELQNWGFEKYVLSEMSFENQVRVFSEAEAVVAPHGAGLVHLLWADDPVVLELIPETYLRLTYFLLSNSLGLSYDAILAESASRQRLTANNHDIRVDVSELRAALTETLEPRVE